MRYVRQLSDSLYLNSVSVTGKSIQILWVRGEDCPTWFGHSNDKGIHRGAAPSSPTQQCGSAREALWNVFDHIAGFQKLVLGRIAPSVSLKALNQDHGWNCGRPEPFFSQCEN
jgi:hypothetical protein